MIIASWYSSRSAFRLSSISFLSPFPTASFFSFSCGPCALRISLVPLFVPPNARHLLPLEPVNGLGLVRWVRGLGLVLALARWALRLGCWSSATSFFCSFLLLYFALLVMVYVMKTALTCIVNGFALAGAKISPCNPYLLFLFSAQAMYECGSKNTERDIESRQLTSNSPKELPVSRVTAPFEYMYMFYPRQ